MNKPSCRVNQAPTENLPVVRSVCEEAVSGMRNAGPGRRAHGLGAGVCAGAGGSGVGAGHRTAGPGKSQVPLTGFHRLTESESRLETTKGRGIGE